MLEIILTNDGSHSLRHTGLQETYHSIHGAVQESLHVFIKNGLDHVLAAGQKTPSILEVGFGTGLNAWLALQRCLTESITLSYTTLEPFPLEESIWTRLNYATSAEAQQVFNKLHQAEWNVVSHILPNFNLQKIKDSIQNSNLPKSAYDIIFFDAFAPDKQPEMWTLHVLTKISQSMKPGATLVTYCAKGQVKRDMKSAGLWVESLQGPPGKREMIRAVKPL